jgi:hypothetical protein
MSDINGIFHDMEHSWKSMSPFMWLYIVVWVIVIEGATYLYHRMNQKSPKKPNTIENYYQKVPIINNDNKIIN